MDGDADGPFFQLHLPQQHLALTNAQPEGRSKLRGDEARHGRGGAYSMV